MKKLIKLIFISLSMSLLSYALSCHAQPSSSFQTFQALQTLQTLSRLLNTIQAMQADFTQIMTDKTKKIIQKSSGHMALQRPGQFRWQVVQPVAQLIVTNGQRLWIYEPDLEQVTIRSLFKTAGEMPVLLLSRTQATLARDFYVNQLSRSDVSIGFLLVPKDKNNMVASIKLKFTHDLLQEMQLQDQLGHSTLIQFQHIVLNPHLPASLFNFKPPAQIDIIDETHA